MVSHYGECAVMKKKVTLTNFELANAAEALAILGRRDFAIIPAFRLAQNKKALQEPAKDYQEFREKVLREHAKIGEDGEIVTDNYQVVFKAPEEEAAAKAKIDDLNAITVTIDYAAIPLDTCKDIAAQPNILEPLLWMFDEPTETAA